MSHPCPARRVLAALIVICLAVAATPLHAAIDTNQVPPEETRLCPWVIDQAKGRANARRGMHWTELSPAASVEAAGRYIRGLDTADLESYCPPIVLRDGDYRAALAAYNARRQAEGAAIEQEPAP